jgi:DNA-binding transcriptional ArsR family regulator
LSVKLLDLLDSQEVRPATADLLARHLGQTKATIEWRLKKLKDAGLVHISGYSTHRNGKTTPTFATGARDDAEKEEVELLAIKQVIVRWEKGMRTAVSHPLLMLALFPDWHP